MISIIQAAGWPIWPLLLCSVVALALILERLWSLRATQIAPEGLLEETLAATSQALPNPETLEALRAHCALGRLLADGFATLADEPYINENDLRASLEASGRLRTQELEKFLTPLATIASAAPLLGLLGTVVGMIEIFGAQQQGGSHNPVELAHGISVALYNTAMGLIVAIPALMFWRYFRARVDAFVLTLELSGERLLRHLLLLRNQLH